MCDARVTPNNALSLGRLSGSNRRITSRVGEGPAADLHRKLIIKVSPTFRNRHRAPGGAASPLPDSLSVRSRPQDAHPRPVCPLPLLPQPHAESPRLSGELRSGGAGGSRPQPRRCAPAEGAAAAPGPAARGAAGRPGAAAAPATAASPGARDLSPSPFPRIQRDAASITLRSCLPRLARATSSARRGTAGLPGRSAAPGAGRSRAYRSSSSRWASGSRLRR